MNKLARFFYRCLYWLVPWWYGLTLTLTRKRRYPEVAAYKHATDIAVALDWGRTWRPDPLGGLLDVCMHPRKFQALLDAKAKEVGDCDDHALYWANALMVSGLADKVWLGTVWYNKPGEKGGLGHVVCVFEFLGATWWADYGLPHPVPEGQNWWWASDVALRRGSIIQAAGLIRVNINKRGEPHLGKIVQVFVP